MRCDITVWIILGIAGALLVISRIGFSKVVDWRIGIGLTLVGLSLFVLATNYPELGVGFGIVGTLVVAGAALMAIRQSAEQFRDDRRERRLGAIITWAEDIARCETAAPLSPLPIAEVAKSGPITGAEAAKLLLEYHDRNRRANLMMRYQALAMMRARILVIAKGLDKELGSSLLCAARQTADRLDEHVKLGGAFIDGRMTDDEYRERWESLSEGALALVEQAEQAFE